MALLKGTNSYLDNSDADTYFADALHSAVWDAATEANQNKALVTATRMLDRQRWEGAKTGDPQALQFPRTGLTDRDGNAVSSVTVPADVESATAELALALLTDADVQTTANSGSNVEEVDAKGVSVTFFRTDSTIAPRFPAIVDELIAAFLVGGAGFGTTTSTGSSAATSFGNNFARSGPFA